jgi:hypothetical protein
MPQQKDIGKDVLYVTYSWRRVCNGETDLSFSKSVVFRVFEIKSKLEAASSIFVLQF